jgi:formylglycine-generating enzyme required for sulfatase activity
MAVRWTGRLPASDGRFEYAARAGSESAYAWGNNASPGANCNGCSSQQKQTTAASDPAPNAFGLHRMASTVLQWVEDCYHVSYRMAPDDASAWTRSCADGRRVARGGFRMASRNKFVADARLDSLGLRVARTVRP